jgi:hypothetical protein
VALSLGDDALRWGLGVAMDIVLQQGRLLAVEVVVGRVRVSCGGVLSRGGDG